MKTEIMIAVLALMCIGSMAAAFVLWAKVDEYKRMAQEEHNRRWDEISRALSIEKEKDGKISMMKDRIKAETEYAYQEMRERVYAEEQRDALQDKLSALLCHMNDHVWKDGRCVKCGRVKDA